MKKYMEAKILFDTVISNDYCIGCGVCALVDDSPFRIELDKYGKLVATASKEALSISTAKVLDVCPFSGVSKNEDELSDIFFDKNIGYTKEIGKFISCYAGYVKEGSFREKGSSGGFAKWIGCELLKRNKIDYFVQLQANEDESQTDLLFDYAIFNDAEAVIKGSKSAYHPSTLANIVKKIKAMEGRFAITGVPCNIKAIRLLSLQYPELRSKIKYTIGIVCGGMKTANYSKLVGWELGIHPESLTKIDFRGKFDNRPANEKIYKVWSTNKRQESRDVSQIYGTGYAAGFFKPNPCDFCDDVLAETADISIGDAWLKKYVKDPKGTSLIVVRNQELHKILSDSLGQDTIFLESITAEEAASAQAGGLRHRRDGLSRRLMKKEKRGIWVPTKRVKPNEFEITFKRKLVYDLREKIAKKSHVAFVKALEKNDLKVFHKIMDPYILEFGIVNFFDLAPRLPRRVLMYIKRKIGR
ncbi:Coenzyme F420 hydrogenase/dehydrogenase, beta subunit C-terminal domain [Planobacterium oryzisoli]|uniref:Coenzyme F420 hydrogenase/dehydrogenase, beta subunit C-terminal domain n=1 Tax=Planobacterium oryzisoli TaxID=2771435 RepID=A0A930YVI9_9FLAO|nr:Coenzyme F420 hydrogenase/dehydrogenase, beta subunit C-terminal domain [Planobacterium oryzisoli]MBF5027124.1 Coenzyme F420 hydrogenase/dehydrogenase, beta subunit C-terminal domain [Planobacterium oryzisoli]